MVGRGVLPFILCVGRLGRVDTGAVVRSNGTVLNVRFKSAQVGTILVSASGGPVTRNDFR